MDNNSLASNTAKFCWLIIGSLVVTRLVSLGMYPLFDTTEARYGEIARIMFETQDWVTPHFDYNVPFWGKPPLHTWLSAMSFSWFGVSEYSARLPHFICGLLTLYVTYQFTKSTLGYKKALVATLTLCSSIGFIIAVGMVMTEAALLLALTIAMASFWLNYTQNCKLFGYFFFAALGLGMLIKGPVSVVIVVIALSIWSISQGCFTKAIKSLPWLGGMVIFLAITLPWYIWAEIRTPGFLEYFIYGEHIQRFLVSGWQGDLYGSAHSEPKGTIWLFWLAAAFPWSIIIIGTLVISFYKKLTSTTKQQSHPISSYVFCWMIAPMMLFTLSGNVLSAYVLPGFSAMAVYISLKIKLSTRNNVVAAVALSLVVAALFAFSQGYTSKSSESELLGQDRSFSQNALLYYWKKRPFSARFYSKGQAQLIDKKEALINLLNKKEPFFLAISHTEYNKHLRLLYSQCNEENQTKKRVLLHCR